MNGKKGRNQMMISIYKDDDGNQQIFESNWKTSNTMGQKKDDTFYYTQSEKR